MEFLPKELKHLYPVGRLDMMSEGLLILTNDGDFANTLLSPKHNIDRVYSVKVRNVPTAKTLLKMVKGITVDGEKLKAVSAELEKSVGSNAWLRLVLHEGRNRHIRRLCETLGHPVLKLKRMAVGPLTLSGLKTGELRHIPVEKINRIRKIAGKKGTGRK
jgi:23S rRNA pseudouridine2605 synthase